MRNHILGDTTLLNYPVRLLASTYANNGRLAIVAQCEDGEPFCTVSVNLPDEPLAADEFCVKTWGENEPFALQLLAGPWFRDTGRRVATGFVQAPVWRLAEPIPS